VAEKPRSEIKSKIEPPARRCGSAPELQMHFSGSQDEVSDPHGEERVSRVSNREATEKGNDPIEPKKRISGYPQNTSPCARHRS
jgi:hypothetical protein